MSGNCFRPASRMIDAMKLAGMGDSPQLFDAARLMLLATLVAGPLAFGAVEAWAWGGMGVMLAVSAVLWAVGCAREHCASLLWSPLYLPALAFMGLILIQYFFRLTVDRIGTREAAVKCVLSVLVFFLTQQLFGSAAMRSRGLLAGVIAVYGFVVALFAIVQFFASPDLLYGVVRSGNGSRAFGPYVNRNHYAGLFELLLPMMAGLAISFPSRHPARVAAAFAALMAAASVVLSGSRGGMAALCVEAAILATGISLRAPAGRRRSRVLVAGAAAACVAAFALWLDPGHLWKRWEELAKSPGVVAADRLQWTRDALRMGRRNWISGVGVGAFETAYPEYQTFTSDLVIDHAHNDYAQLFAEGGVVAAAAGLAAIGMFGLLSARHLPAVARGDPNGLRLGATAGFCGMLVHSFTDFNLHIPANAAWAALALALATEPASCGLRAWKSARTHDPEAPTCGR